MSEIVELNVERIDLLSIDIDKITKNNALEFLNIKVIFYFLLLFKECDNLLNIL